MNSEILDRLPPHSLDAEMGVIGSIFHDPAIFDRVAEEVKPDAFYADANKKIYATLLGMHDRRERIDILLLKNQLDRDGNLGAVGGVGYMAQLAQAVPYAANALHYAAIIARTAKLREIIHLATEMLRDAWTPSSDPQDMLDRTAAEVDRIANAYSARQLVPAQDAVIEAMERIDKIAQHANSAGLFTGLDEFDQKIGGLFPSELSVLSARLGVGKSALAAQVMRHNGAQGRLVYYAPLEMSPDEVMIRLLCMEADVDSKDIRTNRLHADDHRKLADAANVLAKMNVLFDPRPELTIADVRRAARRLVKDGLRLVVVDYLQIVTPADEDQTRERQVAEIARGLKALARELKVPVLALCQSNREAEKDKTPSSRHLRESDAIGQNADVIIILETKDDGKNKDQHGNTKLEIEASLTVIKNRFGPRGFIPLTWMPTRTLFRSTADAREPMQYRESRGYSEFDAFSGGQE